MGLAYSNFSYLTNNLQKLSCLIQGTYKLAKMKI